MPPKGFWPFVWPMLVVAMLARWLLPVWGQNSLAILIVVAINIYMQSPKPPLPADARFMTPPRITPLGKALNAALTPLDYFRVGPTFQRPISLARLKAQAAREAGLPADFGSDDTDPTAQDDR